MGACVTLNEAAETNGSRAYGLWAAQAQARTQLLVDGPTLIMQLWTFARTFVDVSQLDHPTRERHQRQQR